VQLHRQLTLISVVTERHQYSLHEMQGTRDSCQGRETGLHLAPVYKGSPLLPTAALGVIWNAFHA